MLGLLVILTCVALASFAIASRRFTFALGADMARPTASLVTEIALMSASVALFCLGTIPPLVLYVAVWAAMVVSIALVGGPSGRAVLAATIAALCFILAGSLLHFGYLSVVGPNVPSSALMLGWLVFGATAIASGYLFALVRIFKGAYPKTKRADRALRPFFAFGLFAIAYELLDLTPSNADMEFNLLPFILLGSTLLVTVACGAFSFVVTRLGAEAFREEENRALERMRKDQEARLRFYLAQASTDELTGLATRRAGQECLDLLEAEQLPCTVAFIDIDGLKKINDEMGHVRGDAYLAACAQALRCALPGSMVVRWGGDEFLVIDEELNESQLEARLVSVVGSGDDDMPVRFSFGVVSCASGAFGEAIQRADSAMYASKRVRRASRELAADKELR